MRGLIKKDLLLLKGNLKVIIIVLLGFTIMALYGMNEMSFILPVICVMLIMSTFSYDDYNKWDAYAITLPKGRENAIKSKYISTFILIGLGTLFTVLMYVLVILLKGNINLEYLAGNLLGGVIATILIVIFMYPVIYKFGVEKGRIAMFLGVFLLIAVCGILFSMIDKLEFDWSFLLNWFNYYWYIVIPLILIIGLIISYQISKKIYMNKEF